MSEWKAKAIADDAIERLGADLYKITGTYEALGHKAKRRAVAQVVLEDDPILARGIEIALLLEEIKARDLLESGGVRKGTTLTFTFIRPNEWHGKEVWYDTQWESASEPTLTTTIHSLLMHIATTSRDNDE